jgi:type II secretion system protein H
LGRRGVRPPKRCPFPFRRILRGWTLIELVLVVCIIGIMASIAVPRFAASLRRQRVETAARRIVHDLRLAQRHARLSSTTRRVSFDLATNSYTVVGVADLDHPASNYVVRLGQEPYQTTILSVDFGGDAEIAFNGFSLPDSGGSVIIGAGNEAREISVDPDTGQATVSTVPVPPPPGPPSEKG